MEKQYTNKLTPEVLAEFAQSPFSAEDLAAMDDEARARVAESDDYSRRHPVTAIWRHAVVGSLTRNGGTVSSASSGGKIITSSGKMAGMALVGDQVTYRTAAAHGLSAVRATATSTVSGDLRWWAVSWITGMILSARRKIFHC